MATRVSSWSLGFAAVATPCPRRAACSITSASRCALGSRYTARLIPSLKSSSPPSSHCDKFATKWRRSAKATWNTSRRSGSFVVRAAKLPAGVEAPGEEPNLPVSLWGFTEKAEVFNSRAAMIGIFALVALEFFAHRGILQMIGVDVGKGLDLPL